MHAQGEGIRLSRVGHLLASLFQRPRLPPGTSFLEGATPPTPVYHSRGEIAPFFSAPTSASARNTFLASMSMMNAECTLLPGTFGIFVQVFLGCACFTTLIVKWQTEKPRPRPGAVFVRDSSKQFVGGLYMHTLNMLTALVFATRESAGDECDWYWVNIMADCTLGTFLNCLFLRLTERLFQYQSGVYEDSAAMAEAAIVSAAEVNVAGSAASSANGTTSQQRTGVAAAAEAGAGEAPETDSGKNASFVKRAFVALTPAYRFQIAAWLLCLTCMKLSMVVIFLLIGEWMAAEASFLIDFIFGPTSVHNKAKLVFVMIVTPTVMNVFQFWVTDTFLKAPTPKIEGFDQPLNQEEPR